MFDFCSEIFDIFEKDLKGIAFKNKKHKRLFLKAYSRFRFILLLGIKFCVEEDSVCTESDGEDSDAQDE